jgi:hypothetical protein
MAAMLLIYWMEELIVKRETSIVSRESGHDS